MDSDDQTFSTSETTGTVDRRRRTILTGAVILLICAIVAVVLGVLLTKKGGNSGTESASTGNRGVPSVTSPPTRSPISASPIQPNGVAPAAGNATVSPAGVTSKAPSDMSVAPATASPSPDGGSRTPATAGSTDAPVVDSATSMPVRTNTSAPVSEGTTTTAPTPTNSPATPTPTKTTTASTPTKTTTAPTPTKTTTAPDSNSTLAPEPTATTPVPAPTSTSTAPALAPTSASTTPAPTFAGTSAPTSALQAKIETVALQGGAEFLDTTSYQSKALAFLEQSTTTWTDAQLIQRYALACVYYATNAVRTPYTDAIYGTNVVLEWKTSTNWATDADECTWFGITCTSGVVTKVEFISNQLSGSLPEELTLLKDSLSYIDLFDNLVSNKGDEGNAWLGDLTNLEYLYYGTTNFEYNGIPSQISKLTKLIEYDFSYTLYFGELKDGDLKGLNSLNYLAMGGNAYNSSLPSSIVTLPSLEWLYLDFCYLSGNLEFIADMPKIFELWMDVNPGVSGTIPTAIGTVPTLASLSMTMLSLTGQLPSEIGLLTSMTQMWFYENDLTGTIPSEYGNLSSLVYFHVNFTSITGTMPLSVCNLFTTGNLTELASDCKSEVVCDCCTACY